MRTLESASHNPIPSPPGVASSGMDRIQGRFHNHAMHGHSLRGFLMEPLRR
jgi:hypothetical protein